MLKDGLHTAAIRDLQRIFPEADNITQYAKKQDTDSHDSDAMVSDVWHFSGFQELPGSAF